MNTPGGPRTGGRRARSDGRKRGPSITLFLEEIGFLIVADRISAPHRPSQSPGPSEFPEKLAAMFLRNSPTRGP